MSCERYSAALTDAACGAPVADDLAAHLGRCERCRASVEEQRQVVAWIDGELREALDVQASRDLPARVMAQIHEAPPFAMRHWRLNRHRFPVAWWQVAAAAAVALAVYAWPAARSDRGDREPVTAQRLPPIVAPRAIEPSPAVEPRPHRPERLRARAQTRGAASRTIAAARAPQVEVLIPESQTRALARIYQLTRNGAVDPEAPPPVPLAAELQIAPLVIPALVVPDMHSGGGSH